MRPLPKAPLQPCRELSVRVTRFSTIRVLHNTYSVPSRLINTTLTVRIRAEVLELMAARSARSPCHGSTAASRHKLTIAT